MRINPLDNVEVREDGHKYALRAIRSGEPVIKYGMPIGHATRDIAAGEHVHTQNVATNLRGETAFVYEPCFTAAGPVAPPPFLGYRRPDGQVGIRNDIWVIPTVGCVNALAERLAADCGGLVLTHPYGCSQLGADLDATAGLLAALAHNPDAGGVLVVGLGCENNTLDGMRERIGDAPLNIRYMKAQDAGDEFERGRALVAELLRERVTERTEASAAELKVGLKCGGSDGLSGITANPLAGRFSDWLVARGGTTVLTEVPEMFGAEQLLVNRCATREVFDKFVAMVNGFKEYYLRHGQPVSENPSPGNKEGGITTLEDKSLGCVQKGGSSPVVDVLPYAGRVAKRGLNLLAGPGNDLVASTALAAAGCQLILFTTGRGTPFGSVVPTVKVASNSRLAAAKPRWIDWDAQANPGTEAFAGLVLRVASGETQTRNERNGVHGIAIFKDGVTL
jgi:altronate hydrolase